MLKQQKNLVWYIAQGTSYLLHPLVLPTWAFGLLVYFMPLRLLRVPEEYRLQLWLFLFILTCLMPLLLVLMLYSAGVFKSLKMHERQERLLPFLLITVFYLGVTFVLGYGEGFSRLPALSIIIGGIALSIALVTGITYFWKISAHSTGMAGVLAVLMAIYIKHTEKLLFLPILSAFVLLGLLMSARLYLGAHTPAQVWAGACLGWLVNFAVAIWLL